LFQFGKKENRSSSLSSELFLLKALHEASYDCFTFNFFFLEKNYLALFQYLSFCLPLCSSVQGAEHKARGHECVMSGHSLFVFQIEFLQKVIPQVYYFICFRECSKIRSKYEVPTFNFKALFPYVHNIFALPLLLRLDSVDSECCHICSFNAGSISHLESISTYIVYNRKNSRKSLMLVEIHGVFWNFLWLGNKCHNT
jgi:hypothetical protein